MISMDASSRSALPAELRIKIYSYAVTSVLPIVVSINYYGGSTKNTSVLGHARFYTTHDLRALATNKEFREEMTNALYAKNVFDIALWEEKPGRGIFLSQIDIRRIRKCRLRINNMETNRYYPRMMGNRAVPFANPQQFRDQTEPWQRRVALLRNTDMTGAVVAKSEEEIEAMTKTLYAMLEIESRSRY